MVLFDRASDEIAVATYSNALLLLFSDEPLDEPIVGYGPFVMNREEEIRQAITDFNDGRLGRMAAA
jgi:redox-sensitive bicupin YhaK (pirin superfamily)